MYRISIIIPVYNVEKYLGRCLDSVVGQTYQNLEIICVNDGSTDSSRAILKGYSIIDKRIMIVDKENGGLSSARNKGLDVATGDYCYFLDSDDWIEPNTIETLVKKMFLHDVDAVVHSAENIKEDDSALKLAEDCQNWMNSYNREEGIYDVPLDISSQICSVAWNRLYKMSIINEYHCRFADGLINEDEAFLWTYFIHCENYYYLNNRFYNYFRRSNSIMGTRDNSEKVLDILVILRLIYETVAKYKDIEEYSEILTKRYIAEIQWLFYRMPKKFHKRALKMIKEYSDNVNPCLRVKKAYQRYVKKYGEFYQFLSQLFLYKKVDGGTIQLLRICGIKFKKRLVSHTEIHLKNELESIKRELNSLR